MRKYILLALCLSLAFSGCGKDEPAENKGGGKDVPVEDPNAKENVKWEKWQEGCLDIHHLSTGAGDCMYIIMPDGTTMMVDAGNKIEEGESKTGQLPNATKTTGEWIADYVNHFAVEAGLEKPMHLDYLLVTHFHDDHFGSINSLSKCTPSSDGTYKMTGVSRVANLLSIDKIIDRDYPDYCNPKGTSIYEDPTTINYINFIKSFVSKGGKAEKFTVGSNQQFKPLKKTVSNFEIRNVYSTLKYWSGNDSGTRETPASEGATADDLRENLMSCVIKISYGDFDYHCGGDIEGNHSEGWKAIEKNVGELIGETDVVKLNHHGNDNATRKEFVAPTKAQAFIVTCKSTKMPDKSVASTLFSTSLYAGSRDLYSNYMSADKAGELGEYGSQVKPSGHTVVRVYPGGSTFRIFVFDYSKTDYSQVYSSKLYTSRK